MSEEAAYDPDRKFTWEADDFTIEPSLDTERFILAAAAVGEVKASNYAVRFLQSREFLAGDFSLTAGGASRLRGLIAQGAEQEEQRFLLALASIQGLEESGPAVKKLIAQGFIDKTLSITNDGQKQLAHLSGLELTDMAGSNGVHQKVAEEEEDIPSDEEVSELDDEDEVDEDE